MPKIAPLPTLTSGFASTEVLNDSFDDIEAALQNTLSRDGSTPNQMEADLDMNSNRIINLPAPGNNADPVRVEDLEGLLAGTPTSGTVTITDSGGFYTGNTVEEALQEIGTTTNTLDDNLTTFQSDLASTDPGKGAALVGVEGASDLQTYLDSVPVTGYSTHATNYTALNSDNGKILDFTATATLSLTAAGTLGEGWRCYAKNSVTNTNLLTIDPNGAETINGLTTTKVAGGGMVLIYCTGSAFQMVWLQDSHIRLDVASASTVDLRRDVTGTSRPNITGTTPISTVTLRAGEVVKARFGSNGLPYATNEFTVNTEVGDLVDFVADSASVVTVSDYRRVSGRPIAVANSSVPALLETLTPAAVASVTTSAFPSWVRNVQLRLSGMRPSADSTLNMRIRVAGGGTDKSGASDYEYVNQNRRPNSDLPTTDDDADAQIVFGATAAADLVNSAATAQRCGGVIEIQGVNSTTKKKSITWLLSYERVNSPTMVRTMGAGAYVGSDEAIEKVTFFFSGGNITSGTIEVWGPP